DKYERLGTEGVHALLGKGRRDESGDYTRGAELNQDQINTLIQLVGAGNLSWAPIHNDSDLPTEDEIILPKEVVLKGIPEEAMRSAPDRYYYSSRGLMNRWAHHLASVAVGKQGIAELEGLLQLTEAAGYGARRIMIDAGVVRGLVYYTGPVYEVDLTFPIKDEGEKPIRFGSVGGGGRYDGLITRFRGEPVSATGFSIGVSRLLTALQHLGKIESMPELGPVVVTVFDKERIADYQNMVTSLRNAGIRAELYLGDGKFGAQMKYADKRGSPCVVIQGANEKGKGEVQVKDLNRGAELAGLGKEREDYLKKQGEAQFAVRDDKLVEAVRKVLARHDVKWS